MRASEQKGAVDFHRKKNSGNHRSDRSIMEHETAGDPVTGCKWTRKTTKKIAKELKRAGIAVSAKTVGKLFKQMKFSLRMNLKSMESGLSKPPDPRQRDQQFLYIRSQMRGHTGSECR